MFLKRSPPKKTPTASTRPTSAIWSPAAPALDEVAVVIEDWPSPEDLREQGLDEDDWIYDQYFETPEQVEEYMDAVLGPGGMTLGDGRRKKNRGKSIRGPKPPLLPIV